MKLSIDFGEIFEKEIFALAGTNNTPYYIINIAKNLQQNYSRSHSTSQQYNIQSQQHVRVN